MSTISLKLPTVLANRLEIEAKRTGRSKSEIVRNSLEAALGSQTGKKKPTFYELTTHLAGCGKGPGDLSTNKKYMDDYGK